MIIDTNTLTLISTARRRASLRLKPQGADRLMDGLQPPIARHSPNIRSPEAEASGISAETCVAHVSQNIRSPEASASGNNSTGASGHGAAAI